MTEVKSLGITIVVHFGYASLYSQEFSMVRVAFRGEGRRGAFATPLPLPPFVISCPPKFFAGFICSIVHTFKHATLSLTQMKHSENSCTLYCVICVCVFCFKLIIFEASCFKYPQSLLHLAL